MVLVNRRSLGFCFRDITGLNTWSVSQDPEDWLSADLVIEEMVSRPWRHQTNRPSLDAQLNSSHLMTAVSDKQTDRKMNHMHGAAMRERSGAQSRGVSHILVAERDGSCFVKRSLKCKGSLRLPSWESDPLPLDYEHLTCRQWVSQRWVRHSENLDLLKYQALPHHYLSIAQ